LRYPGNSGMIILKLEKNKKLLMHNSQNDFPQLLPFNMIFISLRK
jgi:hypothetical protein